VLDAPLRGRRIMRGLWIWSLCLTMALAACDGSTVRIGKSPLKADAASGDAQLPTPPTDTTVAPLCLTDSDCAPLADQPCSQAICEPASNRCVVVPKPALTPCDTGKPCEVGACIAAACKPIDVKNAADCDDGNPCTQDGCSDDKGGCVHTPTPFAICSDGNPCTTDDRCEMGSCVAGKNVCACDGDTVCNDFAKAYPCVGGLVCSDGGCVPDPSAVTPCDDGNPCTKDVCDPKGSACTHEGLSDGTACEDGSACTLGDRCLAGTCSAGGKLACGTGSPCPLACDPKVGCVPAPGAETVTCDDGNSCTQDDRCLAGTCTGTPSCGCLSDADCTGKGVPGCAGQLVCQSGQCVLDADLAQPCTDTEATACQLPVCSAIGCAVVAQPVGAPCTANSFCTFGDQCDASGACVAGATLQCDDGNDCTVDFCAPAKVQCEHGPSSANEGKPCDDGNACSQGTTCAKTACQGGKPACDDGDPCTADLCDPTASGCLHPPLAEGAACDDGDSCTVGGTCAAGKCVSQLVLACDDGNPCTTDTCDGGGACLHLPGGVTVPCDDGDSCTSGDACDQGACVGKPGACACQKLSDCAKFEDGNLCNGTLICVANACVVDAATVVTCPTSGNPCAANSCQPNSGQCVEVAGAAGAACDDGNLCTTGDACLVGGACGGGLPKTCDDGNDCTQDSCDPQQGCVALPWAATASVPCTDGNSCTFGDVCDGGKCTAGANACQCQTDADCKPFDDGNLCNGGLVCQKNVCVGDGKAVVCPASSGCTASQCDALTGQCLKAALPDGTLCDATGSCATGGKCQSGACVGAIQQNCDDNNPCTQDVCLPTGCQNSPAVGTNCDDGNACTSGDKCGATGQCGGGQNVCNCTADKDCPDDGDLCNGVFTCVAKVCQPKAGSVVSCSKLNDGPCQTNTCAAKTGVCSLVQKATGSPCEDGDLCSTGDTCQQGKCAAGKALSCDDGKPCTADGCSPVGGCFYTNLNGACDDGNPCTTGDVCSGGVCAGSGACECQTNADCKDDGDKCNGVPTCKNQKCQVDPASVVVCDPAGQTACTVPVCAPATGKCGPSPVPDGTSCNDGSFCTSKDACSAGVCKGTTVSCDDGNTCTTDACSTTAGCQNTANALQCDDGNSCTQGDVCAAGQCTAGKDVCGACKTSADCPDDGDKCNGVPTCSAGKCVAGAAVVCGAIGSCASGTCDPATGACSGKNLPDGTACDDKSACTGASACANGACVGSQVLNCDDKNPCTTDACDPVGGCVYSVTVAPCDDGNFCTVGDLCDPFGKCVSGVNQCACSTDADCKDDGDKCNGTLACQGNQCVVKAGSVVSCDTSKDTACSATVCVPASGQCVAQPKSDGQACDDGSQCTTGEACQAGVCGGGLKLTCDDGNPCTTDSCDPKAGCVQANANGPCSDGNACTTGDACQNGKCVPGASTCQCQTTADCGKFEDGDACNGTLVCQGNQCVVSAATVVTCSTPGTCQTASCDPKSGKCLAGNAVDGSSCGGAALCGGIGTCQGGKCTGTSGCTDDGNPCTTAACDGKGNCLQSPAAGSCSDNNDCTVGDSCQNGACTPGNNQCNCATNADCAKFDDGNLCNGVYVCQAGQCKPDPTSVVSCPPSVVNCVTSACDPAQGKCVTANAADGTACDDNNACTSAGQCASGACLVKPLSCNDNNPCTTDACDKATGCVYKNVGNLPPTTCNDNNPCTLFDVCVTGKCQGVLINNCDCASNADCKSKDTNLCDGILICSNGKCVNQPNSAVVCDASKDSPCTKNTCAAATGVCSPLALASGTACDDSSACTGGDVCANGKCIGVGLNCNDNVSCTLDACDPKAGCTHVANAASCNDNNACTSDTCDVVGGCFYAPKSGGACDDGNSCTSGESCALGKCTGGTVTGSCNDGNACTIDTCDAVKGCVSTPTSGACSDGNACTTGDTCKTGFCAGAPVNCDDGNSCTTDFCDFAKGCLKVNNNDGCSDNSQCSTGDACSGGSCKGTAVVCNDGNDCTVDSCDAAKGCVATTAADGTACGLTGAGICQAGTCSLGSSVNPAVSCKQILDTLPGAKSGVYFLAFGSPKTSYQAYCDMTTSGGGWTLVLKANGNNSLFAFNAPAWTSSATINPTAPGFDQTEAKLASWSTLPFTQVLVGLQVAGATNYLVLPQAGSSLFALMSSGTYTPTSVGRLAWKSLIANSSLQSNCNQEGFNSGSQFGACRIGILGNQENDCNTPDSFLGFGCNLNGGSFTVGNYANGQWQPDNGGKSTPAFGYVLVR
jgi:hypothetical protein